MPSQERKSAALVALALRTCVVQRCCRHLKLSPQVGDAAHVPEGGARPGKQRSVEQAAATCQQTRTAAAATGEPRSRHAPEAQQGGSQAGGAKHASQCGRQPTHSTSSSRRSVSTMWRGPPGLASAASSRRRRPSTEASPSAAMGRPSTSLPRRGQAGKGPPDGGHATAASCARQLVYLLDSQPREPAIPQGVTLGAGAPKEALPNAITSSAEANVPSAAAAPGSSKRSPCHGRARPGSAPRT